MHSPLRFMRRVIFQSWALKRCGVFLLLTAPKWLTVEYRTKFKKIYLTAFKRFMHETKIGQHFIFMCEKGLVKMYWCLCFLNSVQGLLFFSLNLNDFKASFYIKGKYSSSI